MDELQQQIDFIGDVARMVKEGKVDAGADGVRLTRLTEEVVQLRNEGKDEEADAAEGESYMLAKRIMDKSVMLI